jgi:hypothetical protein
MIMLKDIRKYEVQSWKYEIKAQGTRKAKIQKTKHKGKAQVVKKKQHAT